MNITHARTTQSVLDTLTQLRNTDVVSIYSASGRECSSRIVCEDEHEDPHFMLLMERRSTGSSLTVGQLRRTLSGQPRRIPLVFLSDESGKTTPFVLFIERVASRSRVIVMPAAQVRLEEFAHAVNH